jgi:four helix bundle protein
LPRITGQRGGRAQKPNLSPKIGIVLEEADETVLWLEFLADSGIVPASKLRELLNEANQLLLIFSASRSTAKT